MRLFLSVDFSDEIRQALLDCQRSLQAQALSADLTRPENLHLTLAFIGETDNADGAIRAMNQISEPSFRLTVSGCGRFGDLWWVGIEKNARLLRLSERLKQALVSEGFIIEKKKFKPHITIARRVRLPEGAEAPAFEAERLHSETEKHKDIKADGKDNGKNSRKNSRKNRADNKNQGIRLQVPRIAMNVGGFSLMKSERIAGRLTYTELYWKGLRNDDRGS